MREKVLKLLSSGIWEDTLLAIELAYYLPFTDFKQIFDATTVEFRNHQHVVFRRGGEIWLVSTFIHNMSDWGRNSLSYHESLKDITPENFKE